MPTYYAEFSFRGKKVVKIDAGTPEEALRIAQETMDSSDGPTSGLTFESGWRHYDGPRLVDDFSTRMKRQSERLKDLCKPLGRSNILDAEKSPSAHHGQSVPDQPTYYFCVPFSGQAVAQIKARDEEQARKDLQAAMRQFGLKSLEAPFVTWSLERGEPKMVKEDLT
jgi:hypothetical protein